MPRTSRRRRMSAGKPLSVMAMELGMASFETIMRRSMMMARGVCSPAEYQRMLAEKITAAQLSAAALMSGRKAESVLSPWHKRATGNAKRLRRKP